MTWIDRTTGNERPGPYETSGILGGLYVAPRAFIEAIEGWPQLQAWYGMDEEALTLLAVAHGLKTIFHPGVAIWHLFRGHKPDQIQVPFTMDGPMCHARAWCAMYRLVFDEAHWATWRKMLATTIDGRAAIPEEIIRTVETPEFTRYRDRIQGRFKLTSDEIIAEVGRRMARDEKKREAA